APFSVAACCGRLGAGKPAAGCGARRVMALLLSGLILGCDGTEVDQTPRVPAATVAGPGVIRGVVKFNGPTPPEKLLRNEPCCPGAPSTLKDETVVLNPNGTLANV